MKSTAVSYRARTTCLRMVARNGTTARVTEHPVDLVMRDSEETYYTGGGYEFPGYKLNAGLSPSGIDLEGVLRASGIGRDQLMSGVWDGAKAYFFHTDWPSPKEDEEEIGKYLLSNIRLSDNRFVCDLIHLIDATNQNTGRTVSPTCDWTLFDEDIDGNIPPYHRSRCTGPRAAPDGPVLANFKVSGTVTHVADNKNWRDSGRAEAADWFKFGQVKWLTGDNAGLKALAVKSHAADGSIETYDPSYYAVQVGDTYEMIPGCNKIWDGDCRTKFNNNINFGGDPTVLSSSQYGQIGRGG